MGRKRTRRERRKPAANRYLVNAVAPSRLEFGEDAGIVDDTYFKMFVMDDFRDEQELDWGSSFIGLPGLSSPVSIVCSPASGRALEEQTNRSATEAQFAELGANNTLAEEIKLRQEQEHAVKIASMIARQNEKMVEARIYVAVRSGDRESMPSKEDYLRRALYPTGNNVRTILSNQHRMFFAASPFVCDDPVSREQVAVPMPAATVAWAMPWKQSGMADATGVDIGDDGEGGLVRLDVEHHTPTRTSSNGLIVGGSGAGKSALLKHLALGEHLLWGSKIIWIDPDAEAVAFVRRLGYPVVSLGGASASLISPFEPRNIGYMDDEVEDAAAASSSEERAAAAKAAAAELVLASTIPFVKTFLRMAFALPSDLLDYLEIALERAYARYGIGADMTFAEYHAGPQRYPVMKDLYEELRALEEGGVHADRFGRLALAVRSAAVGINAHLWNGRTSIDASADIVLIDTQGVSADDDLKRAEYYNILSWCWSQIRAQRYGDRYVRLIGDELHTIVNRQCVDAAMMVKSIVQRARKYGAGFFGSTPQIADLMAAEIEDIGKSLIQNATYRFYGRSVDANLEAIVKTEGFADNVKEALMTAERGRFVACAGVRDKSWVDVRIPEWELELFGAGGGT